VWHGLVQPKQSKCTQNFAAASAVDEMADEKDSGADALKSECESLISSSSYGAALSKSFAALTANPGPNTKKAATEVSVRAMENIKSDDIGKFIDSADDATLDAAMKCCVAGMAQKKSSNYANLIAWHGKITDKAGIGTIMRAMCTKDKFEK